MDKFCEIINENSKVEKVLYNELSKVKNGSTFAQSTNCKSHCNFVCI